MVGMKRQTRSKPDAKQGRGPKVPDLPEFDEESVADKFGPPTPAAREKWQRAKRKPGRPVEGEGAKVVAVSIEKGLLDRCDELAHKMGISRSRLIARCLQAALAVEGVEPR